MKKKQTNLEKAWAKVELNSSYGVSKISPVFELYDENKAYKIVKNARKTLNRIMSMINTNKHVCKNCKFLIIKEIFLPVEKVENTCIYEDLLWTKDINKYNCKKFNHDK